MSTIVQPRCGVKVRARLFFEGDDDDDDDDGWIRNANDGTKTFIFIYSWMAGGRSRVARVEQRRGEMPNARAEEGRGSRATCIYPCETPSLVPRRVFRRRVIDEE